MNLSERLYRNMPIIVQNGMVSLRGLEYRYRRASSRQIEEHLRFLLVSQNWSQAQFAEFQVAQLRMLLQSAFQNVPYYRRMQQDLKCDPRDFKTPEDIRHLPILEKQTLRGNEKLFLDETVDPSRCSKGFTSGTTGTPLSLYETQQSFSKRMAFVARLRIWAGIEEPMLPRRVQFTGRNIVPPNQLASNHVYWRHNLPGRALLVSTTHLTPETVRYYVQAIRRFRPELIDGYPSALLIMARVGRRLGLSMPAPKAIIVSAETLLPDHKAEIEHAFGCYVHNQYAASEPSCFWCDCGCGKLTMNPEYGISEILDAQERPVCSEEAGSVVVTSFLNPTMPLIRYRLGDIAILGGKNDICPCAPGMPTVKRVEGRVDDILYIPERGYVGRLDPVFKGLSNIIEAQIVQVGLDRIDVLVVPYDGLSDQNIEKLLENLVQKVGSAVEINVECVSEIERGANGKFRAVVSKVRHLYPDRM